jgi:DNA-binding NarL/FixJ family response regulator
MKDRLAPLQAQTSVLLVDDHAVVRQGYRRLLEQCADIRVVGEAGDAAQAYRQFCALAPDVVVMDIGLPDVSGIEATRRLRARTPAARVLVFSMHAEPVYATRALQAGASGYVSKASAPEVLVDALRSVAAGQRYLSRDVAQALALQGGDRPDGALQSLSSREFEVLRGLLQGQSAAAIAARLGLTTKTVANHQSTIRQKLGAGSAVQLVRAALQLGIPVAGAAEGPDALWDGAGQF